MWTNAKTLAQFDPELNASIQAERSRQEAHIELIASENYASPAVMEAQGSALTNKYAEGYPGKRYYGGCEHVDVAENLAIERLKQKPGFRDQPDWFTIEPYDLDADRWADGFIPPRRREIPAWGCLAIIVLPAAFVYGIYSGNWAALAFVLACGLYMFAVGALAKRRADKIDYSAR